MTLALKIVLVIVIVLLLAGVGLRARKLRRDELRQHNTHGDQRLMRPPPSPYVTSKGFRLVDDAGNATTSTRPAPPRPRLEPDQEYVFGESQTTSFEEISPPSTRHDTRWALERSLHHSTVPARSRRTVAVLVVVALVLIAISAYAMRSRRPSPVPSTVASTTTTLASGVAWPHSFIAASIAGGAATYDVPATKYRVTVRAGAANVWVVFRMGTADTIEYQGDVAAGQAKDLVLTGSSTIILGSSRSASVDVGPSPLALPRPPSSPLTINLVASPTSPG